MSYPYLLTDTFISITIGTKPYSINNTHPNFEEVRKAIREQRWDDVKSLIDLKAWVEKKVSEEKSEQTGKINIDYQQEVITYAGTPIHNSLTKRIFKMWKEGFDVKPMIAFLHNLMQNPSATAVNELYDFLETGSMPITEDGCFLAYKKVRKDYKDIFSGTIDNSIGKICEMPRNLVDDNRENVCSRGLHFCSQSYLKHYGDNAENTRVMIVKINPADVVSIPKDYRNTKGRTWRYEVYGEVDSAAAHENELFEKSVYPSRAWDGHEWLPEDEQDYDNVDEQIDLTSELYKCTNQELVEIYNELTNNNLVKFRDKATGVQRIQDWIDRGVNQETRDYREQRVYEKLKELNF